MSQTVSPVFQKTYSEKDLPSIASEIAQHLTGQFVVLLEGDLGAGKTTLTRHILRCLGLPENVPVLSPTFTYVNEYTIAGEMFAHADLYRANNKLSLDQIGLDGSRPYRGQFIEWPSMTTGSQSLYGDYKIKLAPGATASERKIIFEKMS